MPQVGPRVGMDPAGEMVALLDEPETGNTKTATGTATLASSGEGQLTKNQLPE
jgi:hypothetical protein